MAEQMSGLNGAAARRLHASMAIGPARIDSISVPLTKIDGPGRRISVAAVERMSVREMLQTLEQLVERHRQLLNPEFRPQFQLSEDDFCWTDAALLRAANDADAALNETWTNVLFLCALLRRAKLLKLATLSEVMLAILGGARHYEDDKPEGYPSWFTDAWEYYADECQGELYYRRKEAGLEDDGWL